MSEKIDQLFVNTLDRVISMMPLLTDIKKQGQVRYIGLISIFPEQYPIDLVQVSYSISDRAAETQVLPLAQARKIAGMDSISAGRF